MGTLTAKPSRHEQADELAQAHFELDGGLDRVFELVSNREDAANEPIKLLEVNRHTVPAGVQPVYFGSHPASGMVYASVVVEVTPEEYEMSLRELEQKYGWKPNREIRRRLKSHG